MDTKTPIAHVYQDKQGIWHEHALYDHLQSVSQIALNFGDKFGNGDWAALAGLWHDLGKYRAEFQAYIKYDSGYEPNAHIETGGHKVDHSAAGAIYAVNKFGIAGKILAYLIAGHHTGLSDCEKLTKTHGSALEQRLQDQYLLDSTLKQRPPSDILDKSLPVSKAKAIFISLWLRMLFSCLTDADFLDTEYFYDTAKSQLRTRFLPLKELSPIFDEFMKNNFVKTDTELNKIRADILHQCREKAKLPPGLFSLTVPTGGGKTLSSMAFALAHALRYQKERIIYVIPYTSIIEQTADIFRDIFGDNIIEHHSNFDPEKETDRGRLACENWDAPIIVTTNVQFFESLFASRTSRVRKLHNIVNSVVILDEAQLLPADFLEPILTASQELVERYKVSLMICTATQPAFKEHSGLGWHFNGLKNIQELIDNPENLYKSLKRVNIEFPKDLKKPQDWSEIAQELQSHPTVLCIVNRRDDCRNLFLQMPKETIHLSGLMCGEHRSQIIKKIKNILADGKSVRVISTQLVEAGVDLDFPVVYRAMSGLDAIAQAAGRCNREAKLTNGLVKVFVPPSFSPPGILRKAETVTRQLLAENNADLLSPSNFENYFTKLYWSISSLDKYLIVQDLKAGSKLQIQFRTAADKFHLIDDEAQVSVIVLYSESEKWIKKLREKGPERWLMRKLQRFTVNISKSEHAKLLQQKDIIEICSGIFVQNSADLYHEQLGFLGNNTQYFDPENYIS